MNLLDILAKAESPYLTREESDTVIKAIKNKIWANIANLDWVYVEGEDGKEETNLNEFLNKLKGYSFQRAEALNNLKAKTKITLVYDSDEYIVVKFKGVK